LVHKLTIRCETDCEFLVLGRSGFNQQVRKFPKMQKEHGRCGDTAQDKPEL